MEIMNMTANTPVVEDTAAPQSVPQEIATSLEGAADQKDPPALVKKIGNMTYWFVRSISRLYRQVRKGVK